MNKCPLKSSIGIFLLLTCLHVRSINGLKVKCVSNSTELCEVFEPINGNDASITVTITPEQTDETIYVLRLFNVSEAIPKTFFQRFPSIELAVITPGVEAITQSDFIDAKSLRLLNLKENRLKIVPREVFVSATALETVDLDSNIIHDIENYAFSGATNLIFISLNKNNLTIIRKATFAGASRLERIELEQNQIEVVEEGAFDSDSLKELFFESNRVKQLPDNIFASSPNLEIAYFSSNGMTEIGRAFYNVKKLVNVAFRHSQLKNVDLYDFVVANPHLEGIYIEDTHFQFTSPKLGETFPNQLRSLFLTRNNISNSNFLDHLEAFKDLVVLDFAFNNVTQIDGIETIGQKFPKLEYFIYPGNPLSCSWIKSTSFDRKLFRVPEYHKPQFNVSDYSVVDGIYCKE